MLYPVESELERFKSIWDKIQIVLKKAPQGRPYYRKTGENTTPVLYCDRVINGKRVRISLKKSDPQTRKKYRYKYFAKMIAPFIEQNIELLEMMTRVASVKNCLPLLQGPEFKDCREYFFGTKEENPAFEALQERQNPSHPEHLNVVTELGVFRSREEHIVAQIMTTLGLRYKYEVPLPTPRITHYPDFAVLHPATGQIIYIEYAGRMNDPEYRVSVLRRLRDYGDAGVYLGFNLFFITANPDGSLDTAVIINRLKGIFSL